MLGLANVLRLFTPAHLAIMADQATVVGQVVVVDQVVVADQALMTDQIVVADQGTLLRNSTAGTRIPGLETQEFVTPPGPDKRAFQQYRRWPLTFRAKRPLEEDLYQVMICQNGQRRHMHRKVPATEEEEGVGSMGKEVCTGEIRRIRYSYLGLGTCKTRGKKG